MTTLCPPLPLHGTAAEFRRRLLTQLRSVVEPLARRALSDLERWVTDEAEIAKRLTEAAGRQLVWDPLGLQCEVPAGLVVTIDIERDQCVPVSLRTLFRHPRGEIELQFRLLRLMEPVLPHDSLRAVYRVDDS